MKIIGISVLFSAVLFVSHASVPVGGSSSPQKGGARLHLKKGLEKYFREHGKKPTPEYEFSQDHQKMIEELRASPEREHYATPQWPVERYGYGVTQKQLDEQIPQLRHVQQAPRPVQEDENAKTLQQARKGLRKTVPREKTSSREESSASETPNIYQKARGNLRAVAAQGHL